MGSAVAADLALIADYLETRGVLAIVGGPAMLAELCEESGSSLLADWPRGD